MVYLTIQVELKFVTQEKISKLIEGRDEKAKMSFQYKFGSFVSFHLEVWPFFNLIFWFISPLSVNPI